MTLVLNGQNKTNAGLYRNYTDAVEKHFSNHDCGINLKEYNQGFTLFTFDLSDSVVKIRTGELCLRVEFPEGLPNAVNMLILGRFPAKFYINESKVVSYDMF